MTSRRSRFGRFLLVVSVVERTRSALRGGDVFQNLARSTDGNARFQEPVFAVVFRFDHQTNNQTRRRHFRQTRVLLRFQLREHYRFDRSFRESFKDRGNLIRLSSSSFDDDASASAFGINISTLFLPTRSQSRFRGQRRGQIDVTIFYSFTCARCARVSFCFASVAKRRRRRRRIFCGGEYDDDDDDDDDEFATTFLCVSFSGACLLAA